MMPMCADRHLFVRSPGAGLVPIYAALVALVSLSLLAFIVSFWPEDSVSASQPAAKPAPQAAPQSAPRASEGGLRVPPDAPRSKPRGTWL